METTNLKVVLTSEAAPKVAAARQFCDNVFGSHKYQLHPVKTSSGVNSQPFGHDETIRGARTRIQSAKEKINDGDLIISIENGIIEVIPDVYYDIAWIVLETKNGVQSLATSAGVQFPTEYFKIAKEKGFESTTVGSVMQASLPNVDGADPHSYLTSQLVSRNQMVQQALQIAYGQLLRLDPKIKNWK